jgi:hypothetical protein
MPPWDGMQISMAGGIRSEPIRPHYVNVASGRFFWRGFLLRVVGCTFYQQPISVEKNKVVQVRGLQKP